MFAEELAASDRVVLEENSTSSATEPLPVDLSSFSGSYLSEGYGNVTLCYAANASTDCSDVFESFAPFIEESHAPELYAAWLRVWSSHIRLTHSTAADFDLQFTTLFPHGYGANTTAFETAQSGESDGQAVFVLEGEGAEASVVGFGMELDTDAVEARKRAGATDVRDWADAWFEKL